ncbi:MAG: gluconate 2-dehydrogenase subunit 3 family protein [Terriglobia bacterium]
MEHKKAPSLGAHLERRAILRLLAAMPAGALLSVAQLAVAAPEEVATKPPSAEAPVPYQPKIFSPHEWKTVHVLCDLIIPADQRSASATAAGVPEFIDDWLDFKHGNLLSTIRGGLTWLDMECNRLFRNDFIDSTASQKKQILDRVAYPKKAAPEDASAVAFFNHFRDLVVNGFFTSEIGIRDLPYLGNEPQSEWHGCPTSVLAQLGLLNKSAES